MKWETENDYVNDAVWIIIDYIDDKPGTRTLFHELIKLMVGLNKPEEEE